MRQTISALLMVRNEERQIRECLNTLAWCDEIVICDSFSTDRTIEICREYTGRIFQRVFDDFGGQKEWMMDKPSGDWVLFVEADERFPRELAEEIRARIDSGDAYDGYRMPFCNYVFGRRMKGDFWKFAKIKLYRRGRGRWERRAVHGAFSVEGPVGELSHCVEHYPYPTPAVLADKLWRYSRLEARELANSGSPQGMLRILKSIAWIPATFFRHFVCWRGYRDGWPGFVTAVCAAPYNFLIQAHYWAGERWK